MPFILISHLFATPQDSSHGQITFPDIALAKDHACEAFQEGVREGQIDPSRGEYFSYLFEARTTGSMELCYFHSPWASATPLGGAQGLEPYLIRCPYAESENLRRASLIHSHPSRGVEGEEPSRQDVALASTYRDAEGRFSYLYLITSAGKLLRFKALRYTDPRDPRALRRLPARCRLGREWLN